MSRSAAELVKTIHRVGSPLLHKPSSLCDPKDPAVRRVRERLHEVLVAFRSTYGFGRGISAVQIGEPIQMIAINMNGHVLTLHNPRLKLGAETFTQWDDCFSIPDYLVRVRRSKTIEATYLDDNAVEQTLESAGGVPKSIGKTQAFSELLQHEYDHQLGLTNFERMLPAEPGLPSVIHVDQYKSNKDYYNSMVDYAISPIHHP